jgi:hypothetical protein
MTTLITIIGWFFAAFWAIRQVKYAHQKNIDLQRSLLRQAFKNGIAKQFIDIHLNLCSALLKLRDALADVSNNMRLAERMQNTQVNGNWQNLINHITPAYSETGRLFDLLDIWLGAAHPFLSNADRIANIIQEYKSNFTAQTSGLNPWLSFQGTLMDIQTSGQTDGDRYDEAYLVVEEHIVEILESLKDSARTVQCELSDLSELGI